MFIHRVVVGAILFDYMHLISGPGAVFDGTLTASADQYWLTSSVGWS